MAIDTYESFWLHYLHEHGREETRDLHIAGAGLALLFIAAAALNLAAAPEERPAPPLVLLSAAAVAGYGPAWIGHFFFEKNRPATFEYPLWSLVSDPRMVWLWATGKLDTELQIAGVKNDIEERVVGSRAHDMATRPYWWGYFRLSLVTCPVVLYPASSQNEKIHFHQINRKTGNRLHQQMVDERTGEIVDNAEAMSGSALRVECGKGDQL
jgi:hypothetical protein